MVDQKIDYIERIKEGASKMCLATGRVFVVGVSMSEKRVVLTHPACKRWSCEPCAERNRLRWLARTMYGLDHIDGDWYFYTLTAHEKWRGMDSVKNIRAGWKKLYNRARRSFGRSEYMKVWEHHKDSSAHLHALVSDDWGERWLKNNARSCGLGYQVKIEEISSNGLAAWYVAKYLSKQTGDQWPRGLRRIEASRNWPKLPDLETASDYKWMIVTTRERQKSIARFFKNEEFKILDCVHDV